MLEYMTAGSYITHFFTDDPEYRKHCIKTYKEAFEAGLVKVGPTNYDPRLEANTSSSEGAKFKRCTSTVDAAIEFTCMALCDEFIGTAGSTVTYFVRALNKRYSTPFLYEEIIGNWHVPGNPTYNFRKDLSAVNAACGSGSVLLQCNTNIRFDLNRCEGLQCKTEFVLFVTETTEDCSAIQGACMLQSSMTGLWNRLPTTCLCIAFDQSMFCKT